MEFKQGKMMENNLQGEYLHLKSRYCLQRDSMKWLILLLWCH